MASQTITPTQAHERIVAAAAKPLTEVRRVPSLAIGEHIRQCDVYLQRIKSCHPKWLETKERQLAPGNSAGSRHVITGPSVQVYAPPAGQTVDRRGNHPRLLGPQINAPEGCTLTHPEHAHFELPPGSYQVSYQLDWAQQQAVRD